jgi:Putative bacterial sensory transduction regulator
VTDLFDGDARAGIERAIDAWLGELAAATPAVRAVDRDDETSRWFVRLAGEAKEVTTVWLTLGQRTLRYETYVMPAPEANCEALYEHVLRRNDRLVGAHFSIGEEAAIFLRGELALGAVSAAELDRAIGTLYATVEQCFAALIRIGFPRFFV